MRVSPPGVAELGHRLRSLGWVSDLFVGGSATTDDDILGFSDLDLVAVTDGSADALRQATVSAVHENLDRYAAAGPHLGCVYAPAELLPTPEAAHPTWTHGALMQRTLSNLARIAGETVPSRFLRSKLWQSESWGQIPLPSRAIIAKTLERPEDSIETPEHYYCQFSPAVDNYGPSYADKLYG